MSSPSLNANNKPSWAARAFRNIVARIDPELYSQAQGGPGMTRYGVVKAVGGRFGEIDTGGNQFAIERPGEAITSTRKKRWQTTAGMSMRQ
jgi:hypothetical protein